MLFGVFGVCMLFSRARMLYVTMFVLALIMELHGTRLGNWSWLSSTPGLVITSATPPFSVGAFHCLLDLLVLGGMNLLSPAAMLTKPATTAAAH